MEELVPFPRGVHKLIAKEKDIMRFKIVTVMSYGQKTPPKQWSTYSAEVEICH